MMKVLICICFFSCSFNILNAQTCYQDNLNDGKAFYKAGKYEDAANSFKAAKHCPGAVNVKEIDEWIDKADEKKKEKNNERIRANNSSKAGAETPTDIAAELNFSFGSDIQKVIEKRIDIDRFFDSTELEKFGKPHIKPANLGALEYLNIQFNRIPVSIKKYDSSKIDIFKGLTTSYTIVTPHDGEVILLDPSYQKIDSIINNLRDGDKIVIKNIDAKTVNISFTDNSAADLATVAEAVIRNMVFEFTVEKDSDKELAKKQEAKRIQDEKEKASREEEEKKHALIEQQLLKETGFEMKFIPGGTFNMGSNNEGREDNTPLHKVTVDGFYWCIAQVTQSQWRKLGGRDRTPKWDRCDSCSMTRVSWDEANACIKNINKKYKKKFRLPTEAEWEYAHRSFVFNREGPEWCSDYYDEKYYSISPPLNPENKQKNVESYHVVRGGFASILIRSQEGADARKRLSDDSFRLVLSE